jgi:hypothetical protein
MAAYANCHDNPIAFLCPPKQQTRPAHIDTLFNTPR